MSAIKENYHDQIESAMRPGNLSNKGNVDDIRCSLNNVGKATIMNDTEVQIRKTCPDCNGSGVIILPVWKLFYLADQRYQELHSGEMMPVELAKIWWKEHGYELPPYGFCPNCSGTGKIHKWVQISSLLHFFKKNITL